MFTISNCFKNWDIKLDRVKMIDKKPCKVDYSMVTPEETPDGTILGDIRFLCKEYNIGNELAMTFLIFGIGQDTENSPYCSLIYKMAQNEIVVLVNKNSMFETQVTINYNEKTIIIVLIEDFIM